MPGVSVADAAIPDGTIACRCADTRDGMKIAAARASKNFSMWASDREIARRCRNLEHPIGQRKDHTGCARGSYFHAVNDASTDSANAWSFARTTRAARVSALPVESTTNS